MRPWNEFERRSRELDAERLASLTPAQRAEEARRLFDELCAGYTVAEREAELAERRADRIALMRALRR